MKTMQGWIDSRKSFRDYCIENDEVGEDVYDYFLGVVPPIFIKNGFQVGECAFHDSEGVGHYSTFIHEGVKFFYRGERPRGNP